MLARLGVLSLALSCITHGLELDVNSQDLVKSSAKKLAGSIMTAYKANLSDVGIPGIFVDKREPDLSYDKIYSYNAGVEFWKAGAVFGGMIEYSYLTGDTQYDELFSEGRNFMLKNQSQVLFSKTHSTWGLTAMTAAEVGFPKPKDGDWIDNAKNVFNIQANRFEEESRDGSCEGGLRHWREPFTVKDMGSNSNLFLLAARLARFTGNQTYTAWADRTYSWAKNFGFVADVEGGKTYVYDNLGIGCVLNSYIHDSRNHGIVLEDVATMQNMTGAKNWTEAMVGLIRGSSIVQIDNILVEDACALHCTSSLSIQNCLAARSFARAALSAPCATKTITSMLEDSAKGAAGACRNSNDTACEFTWLTKSSECSDWPPLSASEGNLAEVFNSLKAVQSLLYPPAKDLRIIDGTVTGGHCSGDLTQDKDKSDGDKPDESGAASIVAASITAALAFAFAAGLNL